jgi:dephospho-CoA kinase
VSAAVGRVALTGGIATGKSHCLAKFAALGVPTVDADQLAHSAVEPGTPGLAAVVRRFGQHILLPDGRLDRAALGRLVFADAAARRELEAIIHPVVYAAIAGWFASVGANAAFGVADVPLLFETGREADFDRVVVTSCRPEQQLERLLARGGLTEAEARQRLAAQMPLAEKVRRATDVIDTSRTLADTDRQVEQLVRRLSQPHDSARP